jgi:hypothetical protein
MTEDDVRSALKSLNEVFRQLDKLGELDYFLEALGIISQNLQDGCLGDYWHETDHEQAYKRFSRVHTQLTMINEFSRRSKKFLEGYDESIRDKLSVSHDLLTEINRELNEDKGLATSIKHATGTCNNFIVDNINSDNYYYW